MVFQRRRTSGLRIALLAAVLAGLPPAVSRAIQDQAIDQRKLLARFFPAEHLGVFLEWDGTDQHSEAWSHSAMSQILAETTTGAMLGDLLLKSTRAIGLSILTEDPGIDLQRQLPHLVTRGFAVGIVRAPESPRPDLLAVVIRDGARPEVREAMLALLRVSMQASLGDESVTDSGRRVSTLRLPGLPPGAFLVDGDDLAICLGAGSQDRVLAALDTPEASASASPLRAELSAQADGFEPIGWGFFKMTALPPLPPVGKKLGLDGLERIDFRWGIADRAVQSIVRVRAPAPRHGLLALLEAPGFTRADLPPAGPDTLSYFAASVDIGASLDRIERLAAELQGPRPLAEALRDIEENTRENAGLELRRDLLEPLGTTHVLQSRGTKRVIPASLIGGVLRAALSEPRFSWQVDVANAHEYLPRLEAFIRELNKDLSPELKLMNPRSPAISREATAQKSSHRWTTTNTVSLAPLYLNLRPTIELRDRSLVAASTPGAANAVSTDAELPPWPPGITHEKRVLILTWTDSSADVWPELLENLPALLRSLNTDTSAAGLLMAGMAGSRAFTLRGTPLAAVSLDPDLAPSAAKIREYLFPTVSYLTADDAGYQLVTNGPTVVPGFYTIAPFVMLAGVATSEVRAEFGVRPLATGSFERIEPLPHLPDRIDP